MKILVVEDEKKVTRFIKRGLEEDGYKITLSYDGADGVQQATSCEYDLIILDYKLPKKDGLTVLHELRESGNHVPVLMLTASVETGDVVRFLDAGADDYLSKPFVFAELQARIRALKRRSKQDRGADIRFADLRIDPVSHKVWRGQVEILVAAKEYDVLVYMVRNAGITLSRKNIAENCWEQPIETFSNIIDVYINYLRKKLDGKFPTKLIHTVRGQGFVLEER